MTINTLYLVTLDDGAFGGAGSSWRKLDIAQIAEELIQASFHVEVVSIVDILDMPLCPDNVVVYTSSANPSVRAYVKDVIYLVGQRCKIVPNFEALMAHENKGFQELFKKANCFGNLGGNYVYDLDQVDNPPPFVHKTVEGAGSRGVRLISDLRTWKSLKKSNRITLDRMLRNAVRKFQLSKQEYEIYLATYKPYRLGVIQEYIPALSGDCKVLAFGSKLYVLYRKVRQGDFRASGSGLLEFPSDHQVPRSLLEFAKEVFCKLEVPFASLDIAIAETGYHLIEYQALNFGPYALVESSGFFVEESTGWTFVEERSVLEKCYADAIAEFLRA